MRLLSYMGQWKSAAKEVLDRTAIVAKFLCLLHVTNNYLCSPTLVGNPINTSSIFLFFFSGFGLLSCGVQVYGPSMLPTLNLTGDVVLAEHVSHRIGKVGRGDLVLVRSPVDPRRILTKRVVGMEGDTVCFYVDPMYSQTTVVWYHQFSNIIIICSNLLISFFYMYKNKILYFKLYPLSLYIYILWLNRFGLIVSYNTNL